MRQLKIFPEADIPVNSLHDQTVQWSEKLGGEKKAQLSTLNVTIRHDLVDGLLRRVAIRMPHPSKKNTAADLRFAKHHLNKSQDF